MKTGVQFGKSHSYVDWELRLKEIKIGLPKPKMDFIAVPGMNGMLDLSEIQNGGIKYENRILEFVFEVRNCNYQKWHNIISRIAAEIQGIRTNIILDTDPGFYYSGRCSIDTQKSNEVLATIVIKCDCDPFKIDTIALNSRWVWDSFNFTNGIIRKINEHTIHSPTSWFAVTVDGFIHNEPPHIVSNATMEVKFGTKIYNIAVGENILYEVELKEGKNELLFKGDGIVKILQIGGML